MNIAALLLVIMYFNAEGEMRGMTVMHRHNGVEWTEQTCEAERKKVEAESPAPFAKRVATCREDIPPFPGKGRDT